MVLLWMLCCCSCGAEEPAIRAGYFRIYDPSVGEEKEWYINDHCFVRGEDGRWHLFGITREEPAKPIAEDNFAHATADKLYQVPWRKEAFALTVDANAGEEHLWAPHVIFHEGIYYMYYCGGGRNPTKYRIHLATSEDLYDWERHPENPMVVDGYHARDPFVLKVGDEWVMYYTATSTPSGGNHIVACQVSDDLIRWRGRKAVFVDPSKGRGGGPTESPFVVRRGEYYYLFIGPRGGYVGTDIFRSRDAFEWKPEDKVGHVESHAAEVIRDEDGRWYVSRCGWGQGGVYLSPLYWNDGLSGSESSMDEL